MKTLREIARMKVVQVLSALLVIGLWLVTGYRADTRDGWPSAAAGVAPAPSVTSTRREVTLIVFAAASLTESFSELGRRFEAMQPGAEVLFNFASSHSLSAQVVEGAAADVFASASVWEMERAIEGGVVGAGTPQIFAYNRLIVILPADNPGEIAALGDLARPGLKLDMAAQAVPAGQYALEVLDAMSQDATYGADFNVRVLKNVVSYENDVKAVVAKVRLGEVDAGIVYATDGGASGLQTLAIPDAFNQTAAYPIAALARTKEPGLSRQFVAFVLSPQGQAVLASFGFVPAAGQ